MMGRNPFPPSTDAVDWVVHYLSVLLHRQSCHLLICPFLNHVLWTNGVFDQLNPPHAARRPNETGIYEGTNPVR